MKRTDLNAIFGNIMSKAAGFSPNILAVPKADFHHIRSEFALQLKTQKASDPTEETIEETLEIPEGFDFLVDKINAVED